MKKKNGGKRPGAGRPKKFEKSSVVSVRLPDEAIEKIPGKKSTWISDLVCKELELNER